MQGLEYDEAAKHLWILDAKGLITKHRPAEELSDVQRPFAAVGDDDKEGENLLDVVKRVSSSNFFCKMASLDRTGSYKKINVTIQSVKGVSFNYNLDTVLVICKITHCKTDLVYSIRGVTCTQ